MGMHKLHKIRDEDADEFLAYLDYDISVTEDLEEKCRLANLKLQFIFTCLYKTCWRD